nr:immunoglobulin light chain junction region [Macaca mulatta]
CQQCNSLPCSF